METKRAAQNMNVNMKLFVFVQAVSRDIKITGEVRYAAT
jgi:hypothetical protein